MNIRPFICAACCCVPVPAALALELSAIDINDEYTEAGHLRLDTPIAGGSRLNLSARDNPASVSVSERADMERHGARDFQDAANSLPGVNASAPPGWGGYVAYRGFSGAQIGQLFNGINLQYGAAARPVGAWIYERVELLGGPSSFLNGSGAVGGSLNYVTRLASREADSFSARLSHARYDTWESAFGVNRELTRGAGAEVRHYLRLDYSRSGAHSHIERQRNAAGNLALSLLSDSGERFSHTLAIEYLEEREDSPYWGSPVLNPLRGRLRIDRHQRFNNYNVADGRYQQRSRWLRSLSEYQLDDDSWLRNTLYHYRGQRDYRNLERYRYTADNLRVERSAAYRQRHDHEVNGERLELGHSGRLFGLPSDWATGFDYNRNQQTNYPLSNPAPFDSGQVPGGFLDIPGMHAPRIKGRSTRTDSGALFVENRTRLSTRLDLVSALRYEHLDFEVVDHPTGARLDRRWDALTGRLGLVYRINHAISLYGQYSTSAEPPGGSLTSASIGQVGALDLSRGRQFEIGSKLDFLDRRGAATLAAYRIVRKNISVPAADDPRSTVQAGQQSANGVELAASLQLTRQWLVAGNVAWVHAEYDRFNETVDGQVYSRKGRRPVNIPARVGNLWLTYEPTRDWQLGLDARYVAAVYADTANSMWVPSYTLYGLFLRHRLDAHSALSLRLRNLTNEVHARFIHQSNTQYYLGEPRSLELAVQWDY